MGASDMEVNAVLRAHYQQIIDAEDNFFIQAYERSNDAGQWADAPPDLHIKADKRYHELKNGKPYLEAVKNAGNAKDKNLIDWSTFVGREPPPHRWIIPHWLSWCPTLLAGRGGIGKSLLAQQIGTALACGLPTWQEAHSEPLRVLYWACEDETEQLWRRQDAINKSQNIGMDQLTLFFVDARYGMDNTLLATSFGSPAWTSSYGLLEEEINDLRADVLILDNIGQTFGANENDRHDVTIYLNGLAGLVSERPFCPIVLGHPSKSPNSEMSGSTAWENAVRMRWFLGDRMPDEKDNPDAEPDSTRRVLAKRKANYTALDFIELNYRDGVLAPQPQEVSDTGLMMHLRKRKARAVISRVIPKLVEMKIWASHRSGRNYLPHVISEYKLAEGCTKEELASAMRQMMLDGELVDQIVAKNAARKPINALILQAGATSPATSGNE